MPEPRIQPLAPTSEQAATLLAKLDAYQLAMYPAESCHLLPAAVLEASSGVFLGAYIQERLVGCGGYVQHGDYAELKRMYVLPETRGLGIGRRLLRALEE